MECTKKPSRARNTNCMLQHISRLHSPFTCHCYHPQHSHLKFSIRNSKNPSNWRLANDVLTLNDIFRVISSIFITALRCTRKVKQSQRHPRLNSKLEHAARLICYLLCPAGRKIQLIMNSNEAVGRKARTRHAMQIGRAHV